MFASTYAYGHRDQRKQSCPLKLDLQGVVSHFVDSGNLNHILGKRGQFLNHLSISSDQGLPIQTKSFSILEHREDIGYLAFISFNGISSSSS